MGSSISGSAMVEKGRELARTLSLGAIGDFIVKSAGVILALVLQWMLARSLDEAQFGYYSFTVSLSLILATIARFGFDSVTLRLISAYVAQQDWGRLRGLLQFSSRFVLMTGILISGLLLIVTMLPTGWVEDDLVGTLQVAALLIPILALAQLRVYNLRALHHVVLGQLPEVILNPLLVIAAVSLLSVLSRSLSAQTVILVTAVTGFVSVLLSSGLLQRKLPEAVTSVPAKQELRVWLRLAVPLLFISGTSVMILQVDIVMLGMLADARIAGTYAVASKLSALVAFGLVVVNALGAPVIARAHALDDRSQLERAARFTARAAMLLVLPTALLILIFGDVILALFGDRFVIAHQALLTLSLGQIFNVVCGSVGVILTMTGHEGLAARALTLSALMNIALNALLIPPFGLDGAAFASAFSLAAWNLMLLRGVISRVGINPTMLPISSLIKVNRKL